MDVTHIEWGWVREWDTKARHRILVTTAKRVVEEAEATMRTVPVPQLEYMRVPSRQVCLSEAEPSPPFQRTLAVISSSLLA